MNARSRSISPSVLSIINENPILEYATTHKQPGVYTSAVVRSIHVKHNSSPPALAPVLYEDDTSRQSSPPPPPPPPVPAKSPNRKPVIPILTITTEISPPHRPPPPIPPYSPEAYNYYSTYNQTQKLQSPKPFNLERVQTSPNLSSSSQTPRSSTSSQSSTRTHISSQLSLTSSRSSSSSSYSDSNSDTDSPDAKLHRISLYGLGRKPALIDCPQCQRRALTRTRTRDSNVSHLIRRHSWLQFMSSKPEAVEHRCSACAAHVANWHEGRDVEVVEILSAGANMGSP